MKLRICLIGIFTLFTITTFSQNQSPYIASGQAISSGIEAHNNGEYASALESFTKVHPGDTNYAVAQFEMANTLFAMEDYAKCLSKCEKGISVANKLTHNYYNLLGTTHDTLGDYTNSIKVFTEGIQKYPAFYRLYYNRGITYEHSGEFQKSVDDYKTALRYNPFHAASHYKLAIYAQEQGEISKAMMCYNAFLMLSNLKNPQVLNSYNEYLSENYENTPKDLVLSGENFESVDEMISSLATKSKKYKTPSKLTLPIVKQNHLLLIELQKLPPSDGFWNTFYIPFFKQIMKDDKFNDFMYYNLRTATNNSVVSVLKKNLSAIQNFPNYAGQTWQRSCSDRKEVYNGKEQLIHYYWNGSTAIEGRGVVLDNEPTGKFQYFYSSGMLNAIGNFNLDGERDGAWTFYHRNGSRSGFEVYEEGDLVGIDSSFYDNDLVKSTTTYQNGSPEGLKTSYYSTGITSSKAHFEKGNLNGNAQYYYQTGAIKYDLTYVNEEISGPFKQYYDNGQLLEESNFENGNRTGNVIKYHKNGKKKSDAIYTSGSLNGKYTSWHNTGVLKSEAEYLDGVLINTKKEYFKNGELNVEERFDENGKKTGIYKEFDNEGNLNLQLEYKKGDLIGYQVFHQDGSIIKEARKKGGDFLFENFYSDGTQRAVGSYVPGDQGKDGVWRFYNQNGVLSSESEFSHGKQTGKDIDYHDNGTVYATSFYDQGKANGTYEEYFSTGQLSKKGFYINNKREGLWITYRRNGLVANTIFYVKGKINGPSTYYSVNGKIDFIDNYDMDLNTGFEFFDTNEVSMQVVEFTGDSSIYSPQFPTGEKIRTFTKKGNLYHGPSTSYYITGNKRKSGNYWNNQKHGDWVNYFVNGQISSKGKYMYGSKDGEWTHYHESGNVSRTETFVDGKIHGKKTWFLENGKMDSERTYEHGKLNGVSRYFDANGVLQHIRTYAYGKIVGYAYLGADNHPVATIPVTNETFDCKSFFANGNASRTFSMDKGIFVGDYLEYYENGQLYSKSTYIKGDRHGISSTYFENGQIQKEQPYVHDILEGVVKYYNEQGELIQTEEYSQGIKHGTVKHFKNGVLNKTEQFYDGHQISK